MLFLKEVNTPRICKKGVCSYLINQTSIMNKWLHLFYVTEKFDCMYAEEQR